MTPKMLAAKESIERDTNNLVFVLCDKGDSALCVLVPTVPVDMQVGGGDWEEVTEPTLFLLDDARLRDPKPVPEAKPAAHLVN